MYFEVADVTISPWLPPLIGFVISFFSSMVGVSGAFLLLPFQMSVLGYVAPSVSATNLVFNLVAIPAGIWQYARQPHMDWGLARIIAAGTLPGLLAGWWLRVHWLRDPVVFKLFVGVLLLWLAARLLRQRATAPEGTAVDRPNNPLASKAPIFAVALVIGVVGGAYGIGGGALMAPVLVAVFGLSIFQVAGATLFGTLVTSIAGVALYEWLPSPPGIATQPDWALGTLFGIGGAAGMLAGARLQPLVSQRALRLGLATVLMLLGGGYGMSFLLAQIR